MHPPVSTTGTHPRTKVKKTSNEHNLLQLAARTSITVGLRFPFSSSSSSSFSSQTLPHLQQEQQPGEERLEQPSPQILCFFSSSSSQTWAHLLQEQRPGKQRLGQRSPQILCFFSSSSSQTWAHLLQEQRPGKQRLGQRSPQILMFSSSSFYLRLGLTYCRSRSSNPGRSDWGSLRLRFW